MNSDCSADVDADADSSQHPQHVDEFDCDMLVVGGGINGAGIARDAAGRGLSVVLCEKDDLGAHTSSASSKLIHGGLRYLEFHEFNLVRKALIEREVLMRSAPHIISPLSFVMPHMDGLRPAWLLRAGLFIYDHLARRELLPGSHSVDLHTHITGQVLKKEFKHGFVYADGWVDDARLVVLAALDAAEKGATILTHAICQSAQRENGQWRAELRCPKGNALQINARCLVNATGAWAAQFQHDLRLATTPASPATPDTAPKTLRLIKGSHIVVKRLFDHPYAYLFQHPDGRIVFAIPYENDFTLIGTTDIDYHGDINQVQIDAQETAYLCQLASLYFAQPITPQDVLWSYSGVRPLVDDGHADAKAITRDYRFELDTDAGNEADGDDAERIADAPLLTVFGGKITTFRKLAEQAVDLVAPLLMNDRGAWTARACLPGGDITGARPHNRSVLEFTQFVHALQQQYGWLPADLVKRYAHAYGTRVHVLLHDCHQLADMGEQIAAGLYAVEVRYLMSYEWARTAQDVLWRRSKLGLHLPADTAARLDAWMAAA